MSKQFNTRSRINKKKCNNKKEVCCKLRLGSINSPRENNQDGHKLPTVGSYVLCTGNIACEYPKPYSFARGNQYKVVYVGFANITLIDDEGKRRIIPIETFYNNFKINE